MDIYDLVAFERDYAWFKFKLLNNCIINRIKTGEILSNIHSVTVCLMLWATMVGFIGLINKKEKILILI